MSTDQQIEQEIQAKGLTDEPRVTSADIEAEIASENYFTAYEGAKYRRITRDEPKDSESLKLVTICVLILRNGHRIVGVNEGPVSAANFDAKFGRKLAREKATDQIWPLLGYELRSKLAAT